MAKFTSSEGTVSGDVGSAMFSHNRSGTYVRFSRKPTKANTAKATNSRSQFTTATKAAAGIEADFKLNYDGRVGVHQNNRNANANLTGLITSSSPAKTPFQWQLHNYQNPRQLVPVSIPNSERISTNLLTIYPQEPIEDTHIGSADMLIFEAKMVGIGAGDRTKRIVKTFHAEDLPADYDITTEIINRYGELRPGLMFDVYVRIVETLSGRTTKPQIHRRYEISGEIEFIQFKQVIPALQFRTIATIPISILPPLPSNKYYAIIVDSILLSKPAGVPGYNFSGGTMCLCYYGNAMDGIIAGCEESWAGLPFATNSFMEPSQVDSEDTPPVGAWIALADTNNDATQGDTDVTLTFLYQILTI